MPKPEFPFEAVQHGENIELFALTAGPYSSSPPKRDLVIALTPEHVDALRRMDRAPKQGDQP